MARRAGVWVLGGAAAATGALLAAPDAYAWLRRKAGLAEPAIDGEPAAIADDAAEATFDTRAARLSLRARLSETAEADAQAAPPALPRGARDGRAARRTRARPSDRSRRAPPARAEVEPMRKAIDEARTRMLASARKATRDNGPAA